MVERSLSMREARGSIPRSSTYSQFFIPIPDPLAAVYEGSGALMQRKAGGRAAPSQAWTGGLPQNPEKSAELRGVGPLWKAEVTTSSALV